MAPKITQLLLPSWQKNKALNALSPSVYGEAHRYRPLAYGSKAEGSDPRGCWLKNCQQINFKRTFYDSENRSSFSHGCAGAGFGGYLF